MYTTTPSGGNPTVLTVLICAVHSRCSICGQMISAINPNPSGVLIDHLPPTLREAPCTMGDEDWHTPEVPESVQQLFSSSKNWTMEDPSPACFCSYEGKKKMLPDCPAGAGGLPPPEVRGWTQSFSNMSETYFCFS